MKRNDFVAEFAEIVNCSADELKPDTELASLEGWDSVAYLATLVLFDERLGMAVDPNVIAKVSTLADLMRIGGDRLSDQ